jgi:hypothetical protein
MLTKDVKETSGEAILIEGTRTKVADDAQSLETWAVSVETNVLADPALCQDLEAAHKVTGQDRKKINTELSNLDALMDFPDADSAAIGSAYASLLTKPGPWSIRIRANQAVLDATNYLNGLNCPALRMNTLVPKIAGRGGAVQLLQSTHIALPTLEALLTVCGDDLAKALSWVQKIGNDAGCLSVATHYLPFLEVTGANFAQLVAHNQVDLIPGGYRNPFRYRCNHHGGMFEAEAKLDVCWKGDITRATIWGVVHVHYHLKTTTDPDANTYYHVKSRNNFSDSLGPLGRVTDMPAIVAIDAVIPAGQAI